jgi:hypothetical protein
MVRRFTNPAPRSPVPDPGAPGKPRRFWLYAPFVLLLVGVAAWSAGWVWLSRETGRRLDLAADQVRRSGYELTWKDRRVSGYPFRLDVNFTELRARDPSGWGLNIPRLETEAWAYAPGHWVLAAPQGLAIVRPLGGPVEMRGELIHASLHDFDRRPPSFSFEGAKLTFQPGPGALPFALAGADHVELHLRPGPDDQGAVLFKVDNGKAQLSGLFARMAGDKPVSMVFDAILTGMSGFQGGDWPTAAHAWAHAGGQIQVRQAGVTAGQAVIGAQPGTLRVGDDGRLQGGLEVSLRQAPQALTAMAETGVIPPETAIAATAVAAARAGPGDVARATLTFQAGQTTLGPVAIGPAPRVF